MTSQELASMDQRMKKLAELFILTEKSESVEDIKVILKQVIEVVLVNMEASDPGDNIA